MKAVVLGVGLQGKAALFDLEKSDLIDEIAAVDANIAQAESFIRRMGLKKARPMAADASSKAEIVRLIRSAGADILVCMLPADLSFVAAEAAIEAGVPYVCTSYAGKIEELDGQAREKGVTILPEMGMDPGIDLALGRKAVSMLDEVHGLYSYGSGVPEPACADTNPLRYKITWTFEGVLKSYMRPARYMKDGKERNIPGGNVFRPENTHVLEVPTIGPMEAYYNGDAMKYIEIFGLGDKVRDMGRFATRWPGHCAFWQPLIDMGFLDETPEKIGGVEISPRRFMIDHLTPRLQFAPEERDVNIILLRVWGLYQGRKRNVRVTLLDYRDLETGFFGMNRTVGFTASIGARMILSGRIKKTGVLNPARDVPVDALMEELKARGMNVIVEID